MRNNEKVKMMEENKERRRTEKKRRGENQGARPGE
jgi:hypothetical protein